VTFLLPRQGVEYFPQFAPCLAKQHLAPSLGHKHHMILIVPTGMRQPLIIFDITSSFFLALTKRRGMLCPNGTVKPFLVSLVEPVAYLKSELVPWLLTECFEKNALVTPVPKQKQDGRYVFMTLLILTEDIGRWLLRSFPKRGETSLPDATKGL
jgi:hypothetical protein